MKILFWILAIVSIPVGWFMTAVSVLGHGLGLYSTGIGTVMYVAGMFSVVVSIVCVVLGIIKLRKGNVKKAVIFALTGVLYSGIILGSIYIDDAVHTVRMERDIAARNEQLYGEGWDAAPAIEGIPELYQEVLNKFYVAVRDEWPRDQIIDVATTEMESYFGDASLDNIGFILMDVNGDGIDELMIGTTAPVDEGGTAIFCMYSDPKCPHNTLDGVEGQIFYLHPGEGSTHMAEIGGSYVPEDGIKGYWLLGAYEDDRIVDINFQEGTLDPTNRLTLDMIPFSKYK